MRRLLAPLLLLALLAGCASEGAVPAARDDAPPSGAFPDVHGVALDPDDPALVLVATHRGLFRGNADGWTRVGETSHDLMGFSVAWNGVMYASGHPPGGGNLGLVRSDDRGATWTRVGAEGADLHAIAVSPAAPERLYAHARGQLLRSDDGGRTLLPVAAIQVASLAVDPARPDVVYGATGRSLGRSDDGGASWSGVRASPALGVAVGEALYVGGKDLLERSDDGGATWSALQLPDAPATAAHLATRNATIVVGTYETGVYRSDDAGATWTTLHAPRAG